MSETDKKEPEYIALNVNGIKTLIDMNDILDIVAAEDNSYAVKKDDPKVKIPIYVVIYHEGAKWKLPIEQEAIDRFKEFKQREVKK